MEKLNLSTDTPSKHHSSRNREDYVKRRGKLKEVGATDAPVKDIQWEAEELEVHSDPIQDSGTGAPVVLRTFEYSLNPNLPKNIQITKQAIFDSHKDHIKTLLWSDGMTPMDDIYKPKVQISKNQQKYRIFVLCTPREMVVDNMHTLK